MWIFSSKEIANLKNEIEKRQKESDAVLENQEEVEKIISSTKAEEETNTSSEETSTDGKVPTSATVKSNKSIKSS